MDFFNRLKPEHLQSFWYFASKVNFALIGTFNSLLWVTSLTKEEAEFYQRRLQEYRWTLRVSSKSAEFLEIASCILDRSIGVLMKAAEGNPSLGKPSHSQVVVEEKEIDDVDFEESMNGDIPLFSPT
jgi:hypothetical protein